MMQTRLLFWYVALKVLFVAVPSMLWLAHKIILLAMWTNELAETASKRFFSLQKGE
jgi:hypothetical protein